MQVLCLDMEGVLVPEIWIEFSKRTGIAAYTQGLMDLGATVCTRRAPRCGWYFSSANASSTRFPRIKSANGRTLRALIWACRCVAV